MTSVKEQEAIGKLMVSLQKWDSAHKVARRCILDNFIKSNDGKTEPELELELSQGAGLFLARLTAWLRMTYTYSTCLDKLLKSIGILLSAASGCRYLIEFLEAGGILILLEVLGLNHLKEENKRESLKLLQLVADAGRKYKELICESYGVRSLAKFLATSSSAEAQEDMQILLDPSDHGNPKYQNQVYKGLLAVLPTPPTRAQQLALQTLGAMQDVVGEAPSLLVEPVLGTLCSVNLEVQHEATRLLKAPAALEVRPARLKGLAALLAAPSQKPPAFRRETAQDPTRLCLREPVLAYVKQAAAAKVIGVLAKELAGVAEDLIHLKVVHGLMVALGNVDHVASQRHASISLEYFVHAFPFMEECIKKALGHTLFQHFMDSPETWYTKMDPVQAEELVSNTVDIPRDMARMQSTAASAGHASGPVSSFPLASCTSTMLHPPQEAKPFEGTPGSTVDSLHEIDFGSLAAAGAGHSSPVFFSHRG
ncbi:armadillo-like helical domain containing protein 1 [Falco peregrinus]|uniref:armadillo-like helical domain containing protein 1 n=1 Tax=Falco peregrinus TaxID=8954 RepID=UPI00247872A2|nr:armadillo-like helical domain containing protein 1 [Falco peregrinus]